jgi:hypothetical protein
MPFLHNWLRKRPYTLCGSCRWIGDLQLCYSPLGPLLLKNLEQNAVEQGQVDCFKLAAPRVRAHARHLARGHASSRRQPTGHNRRCTTTTAGPTAPHRRPHPNPVATRTTSTCRANRPCHRPTNGRTAVLGLRPRTSPPPPPPMPRPSYKKLRTLPLYAHVSPPLALSTAAPPLRWPRWAPCSDHPCSRPSLQTFYLELPKASVVACWPVPPVGSPEGSFQRPPSRNPASPPRRCRLTPNFGPK